MKIYITMHLLFRCDVSECMNVKLIFYVHYLAFTLLHKMNSYNNSGFYCIEDIVKTKECFLSQPCFKFSGFHYKLIKVNEIHF